MTEPDIPTLSLLEILEQKKYRNNEHLNAAKLKYYSTELQSFDFDSDIRDGATNTMAFRLVQKQINQIFLEYLCVSHVFPSVYKDHEIKLLNNRMNKLESQRQNIISYSRLLPKYLDYPADLTSQRLISFITNTEGYRTYGDEESVLASYLSPFCSKSMFNYCLDSMANFLDKRWAGLRQLLKDRSSQHFDDLEKFISDHQQSESI